MALTGNGSGERSSTSIPSARCAGGTEGTSRLTRFITSSPYQKAERTLSRTSWPSAIRATHQSTRSVTTAGDGSGRSTHTDMESSHLTCDYTPQAALRLHGTTPHMGHNQVHSPTGGGYKILQHNNLNSAPRVLREKIGFQTGY